MIKQFSVSAMLVLFAAGALTAPFADAEDGESKTKDPKTPGVQAC